MDVALGILNLVALVVLTVWVYFRTRKDDDKRAEKAETAEERRHRETREADAAARAASDAAARAAEAAARETEAKRARFAKYADDYRALRESLEKADDISLSVRVRGLIIYNDDLWKETKSLCERTWALAGRLPHLDTPIYALSSALSSLYGAAISAYGEEENVRVRLGANQVWYANEVDREAARVGRLLDKEWHTS